ncbi:hypothetical protein P0D88_39615 [Paraburkholderia sp. RL18-103-BIB-C]|uniref:hypothetical protein n=1 Tax=unclassified Paraburkholderia TaxID=2615204 RepID=UPI0038B82DD1
MDITGARAPRTDVVTHAVQSVTAISSLCVPLELRVRREPRTSKWRERNFPVSVQTTRGCDNSRAESVLSDSLADVEKADPARLETNSGVFLIPTRFALPTLRVLLVEAKDRDARRIVSTLRGQGYAVDRVHDGIEAELLLSTTRYALVWSI